VARKFVGSKGKVLGVDLRGVRPLPNVQTIIGDVNDPALPEKIIGIMGRKVDLLLSDVAPNIIGVWELDHARQIAMTESALSTANRVLANNGSAVFKVFEGSMLNELVGKLKAQFGSVRLYKPKATRKASAEIYLVCLGYKGSKQG
jgi:23S rRNA (uridine2552-2'-O)-methyltransferase